MQFGKQKFAWRAATACKSHSTVSTTSAVYVWHDGTQARLLQVRELARLQGLPDNFVLPEGRVVATRLIGNAVPPALIRALLL